MFLSPCNVISLEAGCTCSIDSHLLSITLPNQTIIDHTRYACYGKCVRHFIIRPRYRDPQLQLGENYSYGCKQL